VLQGAYVRAFKGLDGFRREARFGTWLARIVINEALACGERDIGGAHEATNGKKG
jgi:hypothetical protein